MGRMMISCIQCRISSFPLGVSFKYFHYPLTNFSHLLLNEKIGLVVPPFYFSRVDTVTVSFDTCHVGVCGIVLAVWNYIEFRNAIFYSVFNFVEFECSRKNVISIVTDNIASPRLENNCMTTNM